MKTARRLWLVVAGSVLAVYSLGVSPRLAAQDAQPKSAAAERQPVNPKILEFMKPVDASDDDDELVRKMKERHNVAVKLFEARVEDYQRSFGNLALVLDAARQVLESKLDLASTREEQLTIYEGALEVARAMEKHFQELYDAGVGSTSDFQRAKLARLTVEVQVLKLKRK